MTTFQRSALAANPVSGTAFTIRSVLTAHGHRVEQIQYVTDDFVVTEVGRSTAIYARALGGRFLVDRGKKELIRIDPTAQRQQVEQIRTLLGTLQIVRDDRTVLLDGYCCRSIRVTNENARLVLSIETYCSPIQELAGSALGFERAFDAAYQPFAVPLRPDEVVVRSTTRALAASFGQSQTLQLIALEPAIDTQRDIERILDFTVVTR